MRKILFISALAFASLTACSKADKGDSAKAKPAAADKQADKEAAQAAEYENLTAMTVAEVDTALAAKQAQPVDCNSPPTRKKMGTLPGAILVSDDENFAASELPADKSTKLVFYCANSG
jgi:hypothetical protein